MGNRFPFIISLVVILGVSSLSLVACSAPQVTEGLINVGIFVDGEEKIVSVPAGNTVDSALRAAGVILGQLDKTDPPLYTVLGDGSQVQVVRVEEEFFIEQEVIPFESQVVSNESLPEGEDQSPYRFCGCLCRAHGRTCLPNARIKV